MSLKSLIDTACRQLGLPTSDTAGYSGTLASTEQTQFARLREFLYQASKIARDQRKWTELRQETYITLVESQANYALPTDFDSWINETLWDRTEAWPLLGPITPQEWQERKSGTLSTTPRMLYSVQGRTSKEIFIHPTPTSGEAGNLLYYEYQSNQWFLPVAWTTSTAFAAGSYCSYEGNIYRTSAGGTTGATAPTHTSGSASDGTVTWIYVNPGTIPSSNSDEARVPAFRADTDIILLDEEFLAAGVVWLYNRARGFDYQEQKAEWFEDLKRITIKKRGAKTLGLGGTYRTEFLSHLNLPDSGYGS